MSQQVIVFPRGQLTPTMTTSPEASEREALQAAEDLTRWANNAARDELVKLTPNHCRAIADRIRAACAALRAPKVEAWQPISTAPKVDGAKLLLWWGGKVVYGSWLDNSKTAHPWAGWRAPSLEAVTGQPTHWMPPPTGPESHPLPALAPLQVDNKPQVTRDA